MIVLLALSIIIAGLPVSASLNSWSPTTNYPTSTYAESCVVDSGFVYCIGGVSGPDQINAAYTNAVYFAPLKSNGGVGSWSSTTNYPTSSEESCVASSGFVYCIGGYNGVGFDSSNAVYFAALSSAGVGSWSSTTNYPIGISGQSCVVDSGFAYCIAGNVNGSTATDAVYFAQLSSAGVGSWSPATNYPASIYGESCVASSGFVYCIGGYNGSTSTSTVYFASLNSNGGVRLWSPATSYPTSAFVQSCAVTAGFVYCIGGRTSGSLAVPTNAVYFGPVSSIGVASWSSATNYPLSIDQQSCVVGLGFVYCVDGLNGNGVTITNEVYFASETHNTSSAIATCSPSSVDLNQPTQCTVTVTDTSVSPTSPSGTVTFSSSGPGSFSPSNTCTLSSAGSSTASCTTTVSYTPSNEGTQTITGTYAGDSTHQASSSTTSLAVNVFDFTLSNSGSIAVGQGNSGSNTISVTLVSGIAQPVTLSVSGLPTGASSAFFNGCTGQPTCTMTPTSSVTLTITTSSSTPPGLYAVTVAGVGGGLTDTLQFTLRVNSGFDFSLSNSGGIAVSPGGSGSNTITVTLVSGSAQSVTLSVSGLPSGATAMFDGGSGCGGSTTTCTVTPPIMFTLVITTTSSTPQGCFAVTVTGTGGGVTHTTSFTLSVGSCSGGFDFSLSNSGGIAVSPGGSGSNTITVTLVSGPAQSVTLSVSGLPSGATAMFDGGSGCGGSTTTCTVTPPIMFTLVITTSSNTPTGQFVISMTGVGGGLTHTTSFTLTLNAFDFNLSNSGHIIVNQGAGSNTITVTLVSGTTQSVMLSVSGLPGGANAVFGGGTGCAGNPTCSAPPTFSVTLTITTSTSTPAGEYVITVTSIGGGLTDTMQFTVTVGDLTATAVFDASTNALWSSTEATGASAYDTATVTDSPFTATGTVTYGFYTNGGCTGTRTSQTVPLSGGLVPNSASTGPLRAGSYSFNATFSGDSNYASSTSTCEPFTVNKVASTISTIVFDSTTSAPWTGAETTGASAYDTATVPTSPFTAAGTVTYTYFTNNICSGTGTTQGTVTLMATGSVPNSATVGPLTAGSFSFQAAYSGDSNYLGSTSPCEPLNVFDFSVVANGVSPSQILAGASGSSTITVSAINGSTGTVNLSVNAPGGITCSLQSSVTLPPSPAMLTLSCSATTAGDYTVSVTGTSGGLSHTTNNIVFHIVDFTITASPTAVTILAGVTGTSTITVNGLNGFTGTISLSFAGLSCSMTATSISLSSSTTSGSSTLSCSGSAGIYLVTVTGSIGTLHHSAGVTYTIQDFTLAASLPVSTTNSGIVLAAPSDGTSTLTLTITVTSLDGFAGTVTLDDSPLPSGLSCTVISPSTLTGAGTATMSCSSTIPGKYPVTVTGTSGPLVHSAGVTFTFVDYSISSSLSMLSNIPALGYYATTSITVTSLGYTGPIALTTDPSGGPQVYAGGLPSTITSSSGSSQTTTLSVWDDYSYVTLGQTYLVHVYATTPEGTIQLVIQVSFSLTGNPNASYVHPSSVGGGGRMKQN